MKAIGLDNKEHVWNLTKYKTERPDCSAIHLRARHLLKHLFPYDIVYEEVALPGIKTEFSNHPLFADFYIHFHRLMIEVQGEQHYKFVPFFHGNKLAYFRAKKLDTVKHQWCNLNHITLIALPYNESDEQWHNRIRNKI